MSITVTYSTIDHRYFMRRTKSEIISRIEELQGRQFDFVERFRMLHLTKEALASEAMRLVRALPPPPDPVDTLVQVIHAELHRQTEAPQATSYITPTCDEPEWIMLDGTFDLRQLAQAIFKSGVVSL